MINTRRVIVSFATLAFTITASAQVIVRGTESSDNTATHSEVTISTPDRTMVPPSRTARIPKSMPPPSAPNPLPANG